MRDPHVQWCERRTPSDSGGAAYSIMRILLLSPRRCVVASSHTLCSRRFTFKAMSCQICTLLWLHCRVQWLASSFYFFLRWVCVLQKIKCACKLQWRSMRCWEYLQVNNIVYILAITILKTYRHGINF